MVYTKTDLGRWVCLQRTQYQNKAPGLSIRESLLLAGFTDEELDAVKDPKHTWRTGYVYYKDMVVKKLKDWNTAQKSKYDSFVPFLILPLEKLLT